MWFLLGLLPPLVFIGTAANLVTQLGHDTADESATTELVHRFNRVGLALRDFEVPLTDEAGRLSWQVHYRLYRSAVDSVRQNRLAAEVAGYLSGIDHSVRRLEESFDSVLRTRAARGNQAPVERAYRAEIDYSLEIIKGATDALTQHLLNVEGRVERRWRQLLWLTVVSSLLAVGFGVVLLLYRRSFAERLRAEAALRESDERVRLLLDSTSEAIYGIDLQGRCTFANAACIEALGYAGVHDLEGRVMHDVLHTDARVPGTIEPAACAIHGVDQPPAHGVENWLRRADGSTLPVECWAEPIVRQAVVIGRVITFVDISERQRIEAERRHSQKMESVGRLAGGVAHDFNNLLTAIDGYTNLAQGGVTVGSEVWNDLQEIRNASHRAAALTRQLLMFARKQVSEPRILNLNELLERAGRLLRPIVGETIAIEFRPAEKLGTVRADPGQIEQVVVNLVVNARDAMPSGGRIVMETRDEELDETYAGQHPGVVPGSYVLLAVTDTGVGIPEAVRSRIFEPFFTTKEVGKGTGLGLATCYGIVKQHGGNIWCYSEPGHGSTFKVYLPRADQGVARITPPAAEPPPMGSETILLVEDEPAVRQIAVRTLAQAGYVVRQARDGVEALKTASAMADRLDLLVTDMVMPVMGGIELASRLRERRPGLPIIYTSGYSEAAVPTSAPGETPVFFLEKPFTPDLLLRRVRAALSSRTGDKTAG